MFERLFQPLHLLILLFVGGAPLLIAFLLVRRSVQKYRRQQEAARAVRPPQNP
jgi:hypothetical protein